MSGFGICAGIISGMAIAALAKLSASEWEIIRTEAPLLVPLLVVMILHIVVWTLLRAAFAVLIPRRNRSALTWARGLEVVSILLAVLSWFLLIQISADTGVEFTGNAGGTCVGMVMSAVVIGALSTKDMHQWCCA